MWNGGGRKGGGEKMLEVEGKGREKERGEEGGKRGGREGIWGRSIMWILSVL